MEFVVAIILIILCRIVFEYLDLRYRQTIVQQDYWKAYYLSKDFRVKNKFAAATYRHFQHLYKLSLSLPKLFTKRQR